ncbi:MAG: hypothetical protein ACLGQH_09825 [Acidobacteriota bacterium]
MVNVLSRAVLVVLAILLGSHALAAQARTLEPERAAPFDTAKERLGALRLGQPASDLAAALACPPRKSRETYEAATGAYVQTWSYPGCGVILKMSADKRAAPKTVASIRLTAPATLQTAKGIGIGSPEQAVIKAYQAYRDRDGWSVKGKSFVAGSVYDGLIFDFKNGKVVGIFLGAAAE